MEVRPAGFAIQSNLFWLVAISSGFISDKNIPEQFGIVLIKSPRGKRSLDPFVLLQDSSFCVEKLDTDLPCLNQKHSEGYYEEIQMCMGLSGVSYADFVYYTFNGLVIVRVNFEGTGTKKKKREITFFTKNCFMFSSKKNKQVQYPLHYLLY